MDAVTYPEAKVADFINDKFIALRIPNDAEPYADDFSVSWTPRIIILDPMGKIHQSNVGFFPPDEFIPSLELGLAKIDFNMKCLDECRKHLKCILTSHANSASAPEALYFDGVAQYKISGEAAPLKKAYHKIKDQYPDSEWVFRASPYDKL